MPEAPKSDRFPLLRAGLRAIGLPPEKVDQVVRFILELLSDEEPASSGPALESFRLRDDFLSPAETSFFHILRREVGTDGEVLAKIRLGDLFYPSQGDYGEKVGLRNRVDRKHVDFLVCHPATLEPWFGIELDDASHQRPDRKDRDLLVDQVFAAAGLPLLRIPARLGYSPFDLERVLRESTGFRRDPQKTSVGGPAPSTSGPAASPGQSTVEPAVPPAAHPNAPTCPKCGGQMVLRTARTGERAGGSFWGCRNFPRCRSVLSSGG